MKRVLAGVVALSLSLTFAIAPGGTIANAAAWVDPQLTQALTSGPAYAIVVFDHTPTAADSARLAAAGATPVRLFTRWPYAGVLGDAAAMSAVAAFKDVRSVWAAPAIDFYTHESIPLIRADDVWASREQGGLGVTGAGVRVAVIDSGIYAPHPDLQKRVVKNLKFVDSTTVELQDTDTTSGHGTHVAGTVAGDGTASRTGTAGDIGGYGWYVGVAPGADLVGLGIGDGRSIIWSLAAFEWLAQNAATYNIRVATNSWGNVGGGNWNPSSPTAIAIEDVIDQGVTVLFAAGNDGSNTGTTSTATNNINSYCGPRVICVASGTKDRQLSSFSSVGPTDNSRTPTLTAPGTRICSTRNPHGITTGSTADAGLFADTPAVRPEWKAYYTCISGTSMATPHVAGVVALMTAANPKLGPLAYRDILTSTAVPMPGYQPYQVGAGYVDAYAATALAKKTKGFGTFRDRTGKTVRTIIVSETFSGVAAPGVDPAYTSDFRDFSVGAGALKVTVSIQWTTPQDIDLYLWYPDGTEATHDGAIPTVTKESASVEAASADQPLVTGTWRSEARSFAVLVPEPYTGEVVIEYLAK